MLGYKACPQYKTMKDLIKGGIITIIIGGSAFTFSQVDVAKNFAEDTGLTQEQAEQYIDEIDESDLVSFDEVGSSFISDGETLVYIASEIDCVNYEYEWESTSLSCQDGKIQINKTGNDSILLGQSYIKLSYDSASEVDITKTISLIDQLNSDYKFEIIRIMLDSEIIDENKKSNSFNKAILETALEAK